MASTAMAACAAAQGCAGANTARAEPSHLTLRRFKGRRPPAGAFSPSCATSLQAEPFTRRTAMSRRLNILLAGGAFAVVAGVAAVAVAQSAPGPEVARSQAEALRDAGQSEIRIERDGQTMVIRSERHHMDMAQHLKAVLQLRPNQEAALTAYVQALQPQHHEMTVRLDQHEGPQTTPERLAQMEKMLAEHDQLMRGHIEATRRFYDQLDTTQKKAFDELGMAGDHMGMMRMINFVPPIPPMPPMPPRPPAPPVGF
ncbi:MAG: hypothetical protein E7812_16335 [Phenylobacterium sp.]|nr:MAG: hypothetical protein E7812_16335 [Phenylobacterium sp.]